MSKLWWRRPANIIRESAIGLALFSVCAHGAVLDDPLNAMGDLPPSIAQQMSQTQFPCTRSDLHGSLSLSEAVSRALCFNPQTRQAWSAIEAQAAAVGIGRAAYLPNLRASASISRVDESVNYHDTSEFDSSLRGGSNQASVVLNWVLYDFGLRAANLKHEVALLRAASASQDEIVRSVFVEAARAYFAASEAQATFAAEVETEQLARKSVDVTKAKTDLGIGSEADRLQASTAYAQARLNRIRGNETLQKALGALAVVMGVRPGTTLVLQPPDTRPNEVPEVTAIADRLIDRALREHPRIAAAHAQLDAADDAVSAAKSGGRPSIALTAIGDRSDNPVNRVSAEQTIETSSIGLQLSIPLFEGFGRSYRIRQAQAERENRKAALFATQQDVAQNVWDSYVAVHASAEQLQASEALLDNASQSFTLAMGRYQASVGNIIELLKAQTDLASARESDAQARTQWQFSRLQLASSLGQIDLSSLPARAEAEPAPPLAHAPISALTPVVPELQPHHAPLITSITPKPVPGGKGPQALTIAGQYFVNGAIVNLRDQTHGVDFPHRQPIIVEDTSIWVWADVGCESQWAAEVVNPNGLHSDIFSFHVAGPCDHPSPGHR